MTQADRPGFGLALARKWRPRSFGQVVGQEHVVRALTNALDHNRLHHAYLMTGTRGVGKTTLARIMAKALNCETGVSASPCGSCSACVEVDGGRFVDLIELDAASNTQVDQMRELLENALYAPARGRFKVYIIDEVHMLSRSAFNAMLKTLEEPPDHVKFILATTDPQKVPVTVLSRCLQFNLKQIPAPQISVQLAKVLDAEGIDFEPAALQLLARAARGSMRDGLSLLDQAIAHGAGRVAEALVRAMLGAVDQEYLYALLEALARADGPGMIRIADDMQERGLSFESALQDLAGLLHRLALLQTVGEAVPADEPDRKRLQDLAARFNAQDLQLDYQIALQGRADLGLAPDEYAGFTMTLLRMLAFAPEEEARARQARPAQSAGAAGPAPRPAEATVARTPGPVPSAGAGELDWGRLLSELKIGGMARMLAQHSELVAWDGRCVRLQVPEMHRHLLEKPYRDKLQTALEEHFGRKLKVEFTVGQPTGGTPAELEDRARQLRQQAAVQAIDRDPFVRDLVENFDARVIDESIRPVGPQAVSEGREARGEGS
jgi:DNA polymerase-3 subunit gamma/tau